MHSEYLSGGIRTGSMVPGDDRNRMFQKKWVGVVPRSVVAANPSLTPTGLLSSTRGDHRGVNWTEEAKEGSEFTYPQNQKIGAFKDSKSEINTNPARMEAFDAYNSPTKHLYSNFGQNLIPQTFQKIQEFGDIEANQQLQSYQDNAEEHMVVISESQADQKFGFPKSGRNEHSPGIKAESGPRFNPEVTKPSPTMSSMLQNEYNFQKTQNNQRNENSKISQNSEKNKIYSFNNGFTRKTDVPGGQTQETDDSGYPQFPGFQLKSQEQFFKGYKTETGFRSWNRSEQGYMNAAGTPGSLQINALIQNNPNFDAKFLTEKLQNFGKKTPKNEVREQVRVEGRTRNEVIMLQMDKVLKRDQINTSMKNVIQMRKRRDSRVREAKPPPERKLGTPVVESGPLDHSKIIFGTSSQQRDFEQNNAIEEASEGIGGVKEVQQYHLDQRFTLKGRRNSKLSIGKIEPFKPPKLPKSGRKGFIERSRGSLVHGGDDNRRNGLKMLKKSTSQKIFFHENSDKKARSKGRVAPPRGSESGNMSQLFRNVMKGSDIQHFRKSNFGSKSQLNRSKKHKTSRHSVAAVPNLSVARINIDFVKGKIGIGFQPKTSKNTSKRLKSVQYGHLGGTSTAKHPPKPIKHKKTAYENLAKKISKNEKNRNNYANKSSRLGNQIPLKAPNHSRRHSTGYKGPKGDFSKKQVLKKIGASIFGDEPNRGHLRRPSRDGGANRARFRHKRKKSRTLKLITFEEKEGDKSAAGSRFLREQMNRNEIETTSRFYRPKNAKKSKNFKEEKIQKTRENRRKMPNSDSEESSEANLSASRQSKHSNLTRLTYQVQNGNFVENQFIHPNETSMDDFNGSVNSKRTTKRTNTHQNAQKTKSKRKIQKIKIRASTASRTHQKGRDSREGHRGHRETPTGQLRFQNLDGLIEMKSDLQSAILDIDNKLNDFLINMGNH